MIEFTELTPNEEKVLKEILNHKLDNGMADNNYWDRRFQQIKGQDEWTLRNILGSLCDKGLISIPMWPDGVPIINLKNEGLEYFNIKELNKKEKKKEEHRSFRREIAIAIISALIGYVLGNIVPIVGYLSSLFRGGS